ncbi:MAG: PA2169 family four-helix-bundle protein [Sphingomicrobium sp.]
MAESSKEIITLNTLTATLIDSITGYRDAAEDVQSDRFKELFRTFADDRQQVVDGLRGQVTRLGGDPEDSGSFLGKAHQRFMDLKSAITGKGDKAIINEVERGEDYLKDKFETVLKDVDLSPESRSAVEQAFASVRQGHDQMSDLKHGMEA